VLIAMITVGALAGVGWGLIKGQYDNLAQIADKKVTTQKKLAQVEQAVKRIAQIQADLEENRKTLAEQERDVAEGDLYSWVINTLRKFSADYKVELPQKSGLSGPMEMTLLPNFPYKQVSITVMGTAHYHDLGHFISDMENTFPHMRLLNVGIEMMPPSGAGDPEMLSFKMEIITLVKSNAS
jgi:Tfp pilus assembly protein PilO